MMNGQPAGKGETRVVPCGTCTLCCQQEAIFLHPDEGDNLDNYEWITVPHPLKAGQLAIMIAPRENGSTVCRYLGPFGCSIWNKRPLICREFDCRRFAQMMTPELIKKYARIDRDGEFRKLMDRGNELLAKEGK